jgi:glycosyltransferase involved in cell wall biosynthesis
MLSFQEPFVQRPDISVVLVAPNVSEQMGGEAMKALQIFIEIQALISSTIQITHSRNRSELSGHALASRVFYVEDDKIDRFLWRTTIFRPFMTTWFSNRAVKLAEKLADERLKDSIVVIHQTEPNSPVAPRTISTRFMNVFGPINGNIYYPPLFRDHESVGARLRRVLHFPLQRLNRFFFRGLSRAELILVAGGERTTRSLLAAGVQQSRMVETVDCGIPDEQIDRPRIVHQGVNKRFIHFGRLVFHKCTHLIIEALTLSTAGVHLDVVGRGPELERCEKLVRKLGLSSRVRFIGWYSDRADLVKSLSQYRGMVLPSIEDANGIVVQEAMAAGLVPICMNWGGPQLLIEHGISGVLIDPVSYDQITRDLARNMDNLALNGRLAESMSQAAHASALKWRWSTVAQQWVRLYTNRL